MLAEAEDTENRDHTGTVRKRGIKPPTTPPNRRRRIDTGVWRARTRSAADICSPWALDVIEFRSIVTSFADRLTQVTTLESLTPGTLRENSVRSGGGGGGDSAHDALLLVPPRLCWIWKQRKTKRPHCGNSQLCSVPACFTSPQETEWNETFR